MVIIQIICHVAMDQYQMGKFVVETLHIMLIQDKYVVIRQYNGAIRVVETSHITQKQKLAATIQQ